MTTHNKEYKGDMLFVEGKDELYFFEKVYTVSKFNIINMDGYTNLSRELCFVQDKIKLGEIDSIRIVVDADEDILSRKTELKITLEEKGIVLPNNYEFGTVVEINEVKVGVFIMPNNSDSGSLEKLLLNALRFDDLLPCVDDTVSCRYNSPTKSFSSNMTINQRDKVKLNLYTSLLSVDYSFTYDTIIANTIDYDSLLFNPLKNFLRIS